MWCGSAAQYPHRAPRVRAANEGAGISRQHLYDILRERKPLCAEVAVRLGAAFGDGPGVWLLQAAHDAWHASGKVDLSRVPRLAA
jgi:addiction module HigA family antidote